MATAGSSRDARRRRIMERGSDRLALITGRIQTLPSSSTSSESLHSNTASCPPSISQHQNLPSDVSDQLAADYDFGPVSGQLNNLDVGRRIEPSLHKCETRIEASRAPPLELDSKLQPAQVSSALPSSSLSTTDTEHRSEPQAQHRKFFTPNQISSAIASSERTRTYFSVADAVLVVLSFAGFPILGSHTIKRIMFFRPLYLLLLTNISIVLSRLLLGKERRVVKSEKEAVSDTSLGGYGLADQLGKALELGLVLQNVIGAVFMDFSVYAVVLVCGLSLKQKELEERNLEKKGAKQLELRERSKGEGSEGSYFKLLCDKENLTIWAWIFFMFSMFTQFCNKGANISSNPLIVKTPALAAIASPSYSSRRDA
ncbi:hypothetical protein RJ639_041186 [Escallonia herrerae]|uniref:Uncharacterized protein n=1 Tax=Escallonia herrerae TaxID=1293975 RepID=A0AA89BBW2_9ASTE|nr:hypothetical protein RJ639_041186 [Escallonia herrerae]